MTWEATPHANLPVSDDAEWDPSEEGMTAILDEVLGDDDWARYKKAHLIWDPDASETKGGYKLPVARMIDGTLTVVRAQVSQAIGAINGSRAPLAVPDEARKAAYDSAVEYLKKGGVEDDDLPAYKASLMQSVFGPRIVLEDGEPEADADKPIWQHVATEGEFRGYHRGPFVFSRATFNEMVKNFRSDPAYKRGVNNVGCEPVIPWDFHHATDADGPDVAVVGAPAQGWVLDLTVKTGDDGKSQLWALTKWLPTAREYIRNGQYRWASVSGGLKAKDAHTNEEIGAVLTSIAITNTPFIQGLQPLAAERTARKVAARRGWYFDPADTPLDAVGSLKDLLGLRETAGVAEVIAEVAKMQQWIMTDVIPLGVDLDDIIGAMRRILNLPALLSGSDVLAEAMKVTGALLADQTPAAMPGNEQGTEAPGMASNYMEDDMELLKTLAEALGVREVDTEVVKAAKDLVQLRRDLKDKTGAEKDTAVALLAEVAEAVEAKVNLGALHEALGASKQSEATDALIALKEKGTKWDEAEPKLLELEAKVKTEEETRAKADVDTVMKTRRLPEEVRTSLMLERTKDPDGFAKRFPALGDRAALTQTLIGGQQVGAGIAPEVQRPAGTDVVDLSNYTGPNPTRRMMSWVRGNVPGADKWTREQIWQLACQKLDDQKIEKIGL